MSIFDSLKNAIFRTAPRATPAPAPAQQYQAATAVPSGAGAPISGTSTAGPVDIGKVLEAMAAKKSEALRWQSSIVDLMKLVDLDPSLENRKTLATELGYTGDERDSASMNIWLHHEVMQKLAAAGGRVPESLLH